MDHETIQDMARTRIFYVPTIDQNRFMQTTQHRWGFRPIQ